LAADEPLLTITEGAALLEPGDELVIGPGIYYEQPEFYVPAANEDDAADDDSDDPAGEPDGGCGCDDGTTATTAGPLAVGPLFAGVFLLRRRREPSQ
jgi:hypothetical protein